MKRKTSNIKKQQSRHGVILQGSDHKFLKSVTAIQSEEEDEPDDEEQETSEDIRMQLVQQYCLKTIKQVLISPRSRLG